MRLLALAVVLATSLGLTATASGQGATRTITGSMLDSANHKPISQAVIYLGQEPCFLVVLKSAFRFCQLDVVSNVK